MAVFVFFRIIISAGCSLMSETSCKFTVHTRILGRTTNYTTNSAKIYSHVLQNADEMISSYQTMGKLFEGRFFHTALVETISGTFTSTPVMEETGGKMSHTVSLPSHDRGEASFQYCW